jgi:hypothetical protein
LFLQKNLNDNPSIFADEQKPIVRFTGCFSHVCMLGKGQTNKEAKMPN